MLRTLDQARDLRHYVRVEIDRLRQIVTDGAYGDTPAGALRDSIDDILAKAAESLFDLK
jgi:hypothetical protein